MRTIEKAVGRLAGSGREKGEVLPFPPGSRSPLIPLAAGSLSQSSSLTESLEQASLFLERIVDLPLLTA